MTQIRITEISGGDYPISIYISDIYGNYNTLIGSINEGPVPPTVKYNTVIPEIFQTAPQIILKLIDSNNCQVLKILDCTFGCEFQIIIELASGTANFNLTS